MQNRPQDSAVLFSGGLDSAVLVASEAQTAIVHPIYVSVGFAWEAAERQMIERLIASGAYGERVKSPVALTFDMRDVYAPTHWAIRGTPPAYDTPDEDVYIEGRNIVLLTKGALYCARQNIDRLALGPLAGNPFPDATAEFFAAMGRALSIGLDRPLEIAAPLASLRKPDVIRLGQSLGVPFELTLSCMRPAGGQPCGACSKCRERDDAFREVGLADPAKRRD